MKLKRVILRDLFGRQTTQLVLSDDYPINFLVAENGAGKTTLLRVVNSLFSSDWHEFAILPFKSMEITLALTQTEDYCLIITKDAVQDCQEICFEDNQKGVFYLSKSPEPENRPIHPNHTRSQRPELNFTTMKWGRPFASGRGRGSKITWWNLRVSDSDQNVQETQQSAYDNFLNILSRFKVLFIPADRLSIFEDDEYSDETMRSPIVKKRIELVNAISAHREIYSEEAQNLAESFFRRALEGMQTPKLGTDEFEVLAERAEALETLQDRMRRVGLLAIKREARSDVDMYLVDEARSLFNTYLGDLESSARTITDFLERLEMIEILVNERYSDKKIRITRENGFEILDSSGQDIFPGYLSSGEQQELIMLLTIMLATGKTLILIDEPETSLNVSWKRAYARDLQNISKITQSQFLVATHSPSIVSGLAEAMVTFTNPENTEKNGDSVASEISYED